MTAVPPEPLTSASLLRELFSRQRRRVLLGALGWSGHQVCEALVPVAIGLAIDHAVRTGSPLALAVAVLGILVLFITLTTCWRAGAWQIVQAIFTEAHRLRSAAVSRLLSGAGIRTERSSGELLSICTSDAKASAEVLETAARSASASIGLIVSAVVLLRIDWVLGVGVLVVVPLLVLGLNALGPLVQRRTETQQDAVGLAAGTAADLLAGLRPLRGFGGGPEAARRYLLASRTSLRAQVGALRAEATFTGATTFTTGLLLAAVAGVAGWFALSGRISVGELITVVGLGAFLIDPVSSLAACVLLFAAGRASAGRVVEVLTAPVRAVTGREPVRPGPLALAGVSAGALRSLDLQVQPGEVVGVVTGEVAAADTLTRLLAGTVEPETGAVSLGGTSLAELDPDGVRSQLLVEPHHVDLFGDSVRDALAGADPADPARIRPALEAAAVGHLADDLDHRLLDHGVNLSGGQRQRLALARALVADRPVLVLRDPTTAVDAVTEDLAAEGLRRLRSRPDRSTVLITTSPPLLSRCDRVVFLADGGPVHGTHAELLQHGGYAAAVLR